MSLVLGLARRAARGLRSARATCPHVWHSWQPQQSRKEHTAIWTSAMPVWRNWMRSASRA